MPPDASRRNPAALRLRELAPLPEPLRVLVVADDALLITLVTSGINVVGYARDPATGVSCADALRPDVVLVDADACGTDAFDLTAQILAAVPEAKVVVLADSADPVEVERALAAGASGYLGKQGRAHALLGSLLSAPRYPCLRAA